MIMECGFQALELAEKENNILEKAKEKYLIDVLKKRKIHFAGR